MPEEEKKGRTGNVLDLEKVVPDKREIKLAGKTIDVTEVPTRHTAMVAKFADMQERGELDNEGSFMELVKLIAEICKRTNPEITEEFLLDNTTFDTLSDMMDFILEPVRSKAEKKLEAARLR